MLRELVVKVRWIPLGNQRRRGGNINIIKSTFSSWNRSPRESSSRHKSPSCSPLHLTPIWHKPREHTPQSFPLRTIAKASFCCFCLARNHARTECLATFFRSVLHSSTHANQTSPKSPDALDGTSRTPTATAYHLNFGSSPRSQCLVKVSSMNHTPQPRIIRRNSYIAKASARPPFWKN